MNCTFDLSGRVAVVTGADGGLGSAACRCFAQNGADIALLARNEEKLQKTATDIAAQTGRKTLAVRCDVSSEEQVQSAVQQVLDTFGKIDILLNCAGVALPGGVDTLSLDAWNKSFAVNVTGMFLTGKYVVPHMQQQRYGKIVNIASVNAAFADKVPQLYRHAYNASKAAVIGLTRGMAASYAPYNITVNSVGPGLFKTGMTQDTLFANEDFMKMYNMLTPAGRPGEEGELSGALLFFASDVSSYVTGQNLFVDGGFSVV